MADSFPVWHRLLHDLNIEYEMPQVPLPEITWRNGHCRALRQIKLALGSRAWRKGTPTSRIAAALVLDPALKLRVPVASRPSAWPAAPRLGCSPSGRSPDFREKVWRRRSNQDDLRQRAQGFLPP